MTPLELEAKRTELRVHAHRLVEQIKHARAAGDRALVDTLIFAASTLAQLSECSMLPEVLDEVLEPEPLERAS